MRSDQLAISGSAGLPCSFLRPCLLFPQLALLRRSAGQVANYKQRYEDEFAPYGLGQKLPCCFFCNCKISSAYCSSDRARPGAYSIACLSVKHRDRLRKLQCTLQCTPRTPKERASTGSPRLFLQRQRTRRLQATEGTQ